MNSLIQRGILILLSVTIAFNSSVLCLETCDPTVPYSAYADDCGKFNWCVDGYKIIFPCAPGTLFDSTSLECEHSYLVDCGSRPIQPIDSNNQFYPTAAPTSPALYPVQPTKPLTTTGHYAVTTTLSVTDEFVPECTEADDYTGVVDDCSKFLRCDHGRFVEFTCAPGTLFDSSNRICEHEKLVSCLCRITQDECSIEDDFSPVKGDCSKFKRCDHGRFIEMRCANGTLFDKKQKICDHDYLVDCSDRDYPSTILATLLTTQGAYFTTPATTHYTNTPTTTVFGWITNITPDTTPYTTPDTTLYTTPDTTPYTTPDTTPYTTPDTTPYKTPDTTPYTTSGYPPMTTAASIEETTYNWDWMTNTTPVYIESTAYPPMSTTAYEKPYVCGPEDDMVGVPEDCHKYKRCIDGHLFLMTCPDGHMFDYIFKRCFNPNVDEPVCYELPPTF